ncbi:phospholipase D/nuclease [Leucogyrophana mollusca]|uniref:Phospholipase D/nuclease n=1 Tax=Leucogyrophana mollusca TaxID=85980 RepID=A0ACB8BPT3_9AGAM|nr:phospholipase D/nuclease [Leucogyrophana mollusca]
MDDDLARAIALSLQGSRAPNEPIIIDDSDAEDDDETRFQTELRRAIEESKAQSSRASIHPAQSPPESASGIPSAPYLSERAKLEQERLERLKRMRGDVDLEGGSARPAKRQYTSSSQVQTNGRANNTASASSSIATNAHSEAKGTTSIGNILPIDQLFWDGELRPVANIHTNPRQDGKPVFRLTEILGQKADISFAIISSYSTSISWIYGFFDRSTPVIIVGQPDESGQAGIKNVLPNWTLTVPFLRNGRGCMHMKFMLLFYKSGRLRVVISTANLIDYDYRDIENAMWLQDLPLRSSAIAHDPKVVGDFPSLMQGVLRAVNVRAALANMLCNDHPNLPLQSINDLRMKWDWSKVKVKLVPSLAGKHEGWPNVILTGHTALMKSIRDMGLRTGKGKAAKDLVIECQGSSIGTYSTQWMNEFHWSARGESAADWLDEPKTRRSKMPWPPVKVVFPSVKTVRETVLGERVGLYLLRSLHERQKVVLNLSQGGGTMFCRRNQWEATKFPKELFHDSNSTAGGVLMHTKMIIGTYKQKKSIVASSKGKGQAVDDTDSETEDDDEVKVQNDPVGWAYVGSHNFTPSAWGTLSGSGFNPVLNIVNFELGIVFPLYDEKDIERVSCFKRPPRKYVAGQDRPWIQEESEVLNG